MLKVWVSFNVCHFMCSRSVLYFWAVRSLVNSKSRDGEGPVTVKSIDSVRSVKSHLKERKLCINIFNQIWFVLDRRDFSLYYTCSGCKKHLLRKLGATILQICLTASDFLLLCSELAWECAGQNRQYQTCTHIWRTIAVLLWKGCSIKCQSFTRTRLKVLCWDMF